MQPPHLVGGERVRGPQRAHPRPPQSLVRVDVPEAGDDSLIEEDRLERRLPASEARCEPTRREPPAEGLRPVLRGEVLGRVRVLEDEPRPETANIPEHEPRAVVELQHGALVARRHEPEAARHAEVDEEREPALEAHNEVFPPPLDGEHAIALELLGDLEQVERSRESGIEDLDAREGTSRETRLELRADRLDLGQLGHGGIVSLLPMPAEQPQTWHYGLVAQWWAEFNDDFRPHEIPYFQRFVEDGGQPALDVACGTGRLLIPYLRAGLDVDGCDVSADMIALCREKAEREGLAPNLFVQPMYALDLPRRYRTIYVCGAFGLGSDRAKDRQALERFHEHLEPGGTLVLDNEMPYAHAKGWMYWLRPERASLPELAQDAGERRPTSDSSELALQVRLLDLDPLEQHAVYEMRAERWRDGKLEVEEVHRLDNGLYFRNELVLMLEHTGFGDVVVHGEHEVRDASPDDNFVVIVARK